MIELCSRCSRRVSPFERKYAWGRIWHPHCFSCNRCNKYLNDCSIAFHNGQLLCRDCYSFHELPPPCVKPQNRCEICKCRSVCSKNGKTCERCNRFKSLIEDSKSNLCSKSNVCDKNTSTFSNINFCPSANSTMNKATSTCSIQQPPTTPNLFNLINNTSCQSKTRQKGSSSQCGTFKSGNLTKEESWPFELKKQPSSCRTQCRYIFKNKNQCPHILQSQKCPPENCPSKSSKCNLNQNLSGSCCPGSTSKCPGEKSSSKWIPKFHATNDSCLPKDRQRKKFVVLALPILGEMEM